MRELITSSAVPILSLTLRTWLRYLAPLTILSAIVMLPVAWIALHVHAAADLVEAHGQLLRGWELAASAWIFQIVLVGAAAPAVRAIAAGKPLSQLAAFASGARGLVRAVVPCTIAVLAVMIGGLALVVPGLVLLAMLAMTGASDELGTALPAPLLDSVAVARASLRTIAIVVGAILALDLAIALGAQLALVHALPKKPPIALLVPSRTYVRVVACALIALSALPACALASVYTRRQ